VSFAANRRLYGQWTTAVPSRFLAELPAEHVEVLHRSPRARPDWELLGDPLPALRPAPFRTRRLAADRVLEGRAEILASRPPAGSRTFRVGERIFHDKFGYGRIEAIDGDKLEIAFEKAGRKKVVDSFVDPA
jgi:DNA helicase-2/ATP-dependent DNA helicase PcrA